MLNDKRNLGIAAAFVVLAGVAVAGWVRHPPAGGNLNATYPQGVVQTQGVMQTNDPGVPTPGTYVSDRTYLPDAGHIGQSGYANRYAGTYQQDGYYSSIHRPLNVRQNVAPQQVIVEQQPQERVYNSRRETHVYSSEVHRGRSTGKSAAIVAGSAGAGAAIGAIAGGGKGAALGAVSGGGAGFIYDRLTHNH